MKRVLIILVLLVVAALGYLVAAHLTGGTLPTFGLPIGGETASVRKQALAFVEDLHFRDLNKAARVLAPGEQNVETVQSFLQRLFGANVDQLDLGDCSIEGIEVDSTGTRARVKLKIKAKDLTTNKILQPEMLLFFKRSAPDQPWYLTTK